MRFFRKKEEELSDQLAVFQKREAPRFVLNAGISIDGFEGEGQVVNISISGCCMKSVTYVAITPSQVYQARILPVPDDRMEPFNIKLKLNWIKSSETSFLAGFSLDKGQSNNNFVRYVDLLKAKGVKPDYGNMSPERYKQS